MQQFDYLRSQCGAIELVNVELTDKRALCGWAFIEAWTQGAIVFRNDRAVEICTIVLPAELQNLPTPVAVSSPNDDLFFAVNNAEISQTTV